VRPVLALAAFAAVLTGCTGPTELTNADVEAQRKQFSQENYEKSLRNSGKTAEADQVKQDAAAHEADRDR
jgi:hypothetical protein